MKEGHINFMNELIKIENIEISKGIIKIYILLNQRKMENDNNSASNFFLLKLNDIKSIKEFKDFDWNFFNNIRINCKVKVTTYEKLKNSTNIKLISNDNILDNENNNRYKPNINNNNNSLNVQDRLKKFYFKDKNNFMNNETNVNKEGPKKIEVNQNIYGRPRATRIIVSKDKINIMKKNENLNININDNNKEKALHQFLYGKTEGNEETNEQKINKIRTELPKMENEKKEKNNYYFIPNKNVKKLKEQKKNTDNNILISLQNPKSYYEQELKQNKQDNTPIKIQNKISFGDNIKKKIKNIVVSISPKNKKQKNVKNEKNEEPQEQIEKKEENNDENNKKNTEDNENTNSQIDNKIIYQNRNNSTGSRKVKKDLKDKYNITVNPNYLKELNEKKKEYYKKEYCNIEPTNYTQYLKRLKLSKNPFERETFCEGFFIASFPTINGEVIENSQSFPSPCKHKDCSTLAAMKPEIIMRYPLNDTKNLELNNLAATICFPTGIKVCYSEEEPTNMIDDYLTSITNQKGERYYMMTYHFYQKISNNEYSKKYQMHPLKNHLMKFGDSYLTLSDEGFTEKIVKKVQDTLEFCQELGFRDFVYVPFCLCLISKYPYAYEMMRSLQSIFNVMSEEKIMEYSKIQIKINDLIMYLINSVPVPIEKNTRVKFYIPFFDKGISLKCPKIDEINIVNINYIQLIDLFSIDNIIIIILLLLSEKKILFIDDDYTRLSQVTDAFTSLLYPFKWIHTYIPIMSDQMLKYLETFLPFLNGIHSSLMPLVTNVFNNGEIDDSEDVFLIYNKEGKIDLSSNLKKKKKKVSKYIQSNIPSLPVSIEKKLRNSLIEIKDSYNNEMKSNVKRYSKTPNPIDPAQYNINIRNAFIQMFVDMFRDYPKYMCLLDNDVVFNKNSFMNSVDKHDKKFYDEFLETQIFQQFTQSIFNYEGDYFNKVIKTDVYDKSEFSGIFLDVKLEKVFVIPPKYLGTNEKENQSIQAFISQYYPNNLKNNFLSKDEYKDSNGIILPSHRVIPSVTKIENKGYNNDDCLIYMLPNHNRVSMKRSLLRDSSFKILETIKNRPINKEEIEVLKKAATNVGFIDELNEKDKDEIKEIIKDYLRYIFKSENINYKDPKIKSEILSLLKKPFGREFFVNMLSSNLKNVVLLQPNSFSFLGFLIYNVVVGTLHAAETDKLLEEVYLLIKSTMYFGIEHNGKTKTLFQSIKSKIRDYPKFTQKNFWTIWYEKEMKIKKDKGDSYKQLVILNVCSKMVELEIDKIIIKDILDDLNNKALGKNSEMGAQTQKMYMRKITDTKYTTKE